MSDRVNVHFPVVSGTPIGSLLVNVSPTGSGIQQQINGMQWEHRKQAGGTKVLFLTPDHLSLEYGRGDFDHFPPFRAEFESAYNAFIAIYPDARVTRIGLRYVNQFKFDEGNPLDWDNLIAPHLISAVKAGVPQGAGLARSMHQLQIRRENLALLMTYGIYNSEFPAVVSRREFILDLDGYRAEVIPTNEVLATIASLNGMCEDTFEASIAEGMRIQMEPIND